MLKYLLVKTTVTTDPNNCHALVSSSESKTYEDLISGMTAEGTGLTRPQAMAYFEKLMQIIMGFVGEGYSVNTPFIRVRPTIKGLFTNKSDRFDPSRHQLNICISPGSRLREMALKIQLEKAVTPQKKLIIDSFYDAVSKKKNLTVTAGGVGLLKGNGMDFDADDVRQGIFFVSADNPENEVRATTYSGLKPSEAHFQIPSLTAGEYFITVKNRPKTGQPPKTAKLGIPVLV